MYTHGGSISDGMAHDDCLVMLDAANAHTFYPCERDRDFSLSFRNVRLDLFAVTDCRSARCAPNTLSRVGSCFSKPLNACMIVAVFLRTTMA